VILKRNSSLLLSLWYTVKQHLHEVLFKCPKGHWCDNA